MLLSCSLHCILLTITCLQEKEKQKQLHVHEKTTHASRMNALTAGRRKEVVSPNLPAEVTAKDTSHLDDAEFVLATTRGKHRKCAQPARWYWMLAFDYWCS